jgi:N-formylglutamate amidohydrolase
MPDEVGFVSERLVKKEIRLLSDWCVNEIFAVPGITTIRAEVSRVYCDVERLPDDVEPMAKFGMGIIYEQTDDGRVLRRIDDTKKREIIRKYYQPYHQALEDAVGDKLDRYGECLIVDCHTFAAQPFRRDLDQTVERPDICLGTDDFHTPAATTAWFREFFENRGLSVKENSPYAGAIVPSKYYQKNAAVHTIMIEINRKLYMTNGRPVPAKIAQLNQLLNELVVQYKAWFPKNIDFMGMVV